MGIEDLKSFGFTGLAIIFVPGDDCIGGERNAELHQASHTHDIAVLW
jgi:hypothetical protein